jgi:hypothetical protein
MVCLRNICVNTLHKGDDDDDDDDDDNINNNNNNNNNNNDKSRTAVAVQCAVFLACFQICYPCRRQLGLYIERCIGGGGLGLVQLLIWLGRAVRDDVMVICIGGTTFVSINRH